MLLEALIALSPYQAKISQIHPAFSSPDFIKAVHKSNLCPPGPVDGDVDGGVALFLLKDLHLALFEGDHIQYSQCLADSLALLQGLLPHN